MQHSPGQYDDLAGVPRARPREGCRRRTTASRHRRHSSPRCSCRVVPPIRDARFVDLNLAVFMGATPAGARNGFAEPRDREPKSTLSRPQLATETVRPAFEGAEMPANCGLFVGDRETSVRIGLRGGPGRIRTSNQFVMNLSRPQPAAETVRLAFEPAK